MNQHGDTTLLDTPIIKVAVDAPLRQSLDYLPEQGRDVNDYPRGSRVAVPFGKRTVAGIVVGNADSSEFSAKQLKPITSAFDEPLFALQSTLECAEWMSDYYLYPIGQTLFSLLPNALRKAIDAPLYRQRRWFITTHGKGLPENALPRAKKQQQLLQLLRTDDERATGAGLTDAQLAAQECSLSVARALLKKQLIGSHATIFTPTTAEGCKSLVAATCLRDELPLLDEQSLALQSISARSNFRTVLLEGVTGSGKTEVYLQAISRVLDRDQQAIVLVPEIGLTPQTIQRFTERFNTVIAVLHSNLSDKDRLAAWHAASTGKAGIVIGTRSAIITPLKNPGLIIVDEEHDASYKQQDGLRYNARDIAVMRGKKENIPVILGSATPSLESLHNAKNNRYTHLQLTQRAGNAQLPNISLVDIRRIPLHEGFSDEAIQTIAQTLESGRQAMVFINRRGFAPLLMCHDCGWQAHCNHCDARLTLHKQRRELRCHHCDFRRNIPHRCERCQSTQLLHIGEGTERCAEALANLFPNSTIIRVDRDTTSTKSAFDAHVEHINQQRPCILIGTQMLAKGHHFAALDAVIMLDIDQGLYHPDFRAFEKTLQLLTQVAGRAGRADRQGTVLIQTHLPEHPLLQAWLERGYQGVSAELLQQREPLRLPPFGFLAVIRADSTDPNAATVFLNQLRRQLDAAVDGKVIKLIGPMPALMERRAGRHRAQLMLHTASRKVLHSTTASATAIAATIKAPNALRWSVDVDPLEII